MRVDLFSSTVSTYASLTGFKQIVCAILSMCLLRWNFEKDFHFGST